MTSPQAFEGLRLTGRKVRRPDLTLAVPDHNVPTTDRSKGIAEEQSRSRSTRCSATAASSASAVRRRRVRQGIVHVIGPEQGFTLPGMTIVCGDSHTSTHGAFGALAFGIGTSEVEHVLATQTLLQMRPKKMRIASRATCRRRHRQGRDPRDHRQDRHRRRQRPRDRVRGEVMRGLSMAGRMTVCNMSIEAGARAGLIAPDDMTFGYLKGRPLAPKGGELERRSRTGGSCRPMRARVRQVGRDRRAPRSSRR